MTGVTEFNVTASNSVDERFNTAMIIDEKEADCGEIRGTFQGSTGPNGGRFGRGDASGVATNYLRVLSGKHVAV